MSNGRMRKCLKRAVGELAAKAEAEDRFLKCIPAFHHATDLHEITCMRLSF